MEMMTVKLGPCTNVCTPEGCARAGSVVSMPKPKAMILVDEGLAQPYTGGRQPDRTYLNYSAPSDPRQHAVARQGK